MSSINNFNDHGINRGVELILRRRVKKKEENKECKKIKFFKKISFLKKEFCIKIEFYLKEKQ